MAHGVEFSVVKGDITTFDADVVALKYAQAFYGVDRIVSNMLVNTGIGIESLSPKEGKYSYFAVGASLRARNVLFVGVADLYSFSYPQIRQFAAKVLSVLANKAPETKHVAMTLHGTGYGLDEIECALSQLSGYLDALVSGKFPHALERISIVDRDSQRVARLQKLFSERLESRHDATRLAKTTEWIYELEVPDSRSHIQRNIKDIELVDSLHAKAHAFVAMPFSKDMDDVFFYGIQQPVHAVGLLCARVDQIAFVGDILNQVLNKIETSACVIAELTGANANVYLEVGYAWGKNRPTLFLAKDSSELKFDIRGQRCIIYSSIKDLAGKLTNELQQLHAQGVL